jgi:hypothetical protein
MKSNTMITRLAIAVSVTLSLTSAIRLFAEAHPHPPIQRLPQVTTTSPQSTPAQQVTTADISGGIKRHIASTRKQSSDKKFHIKYQGKDLALDLIRVHDDQLSSLGGGKYFACVDMKATNGTVYDIDFFMAGQPGSMNVTETSVHKINGKPLYDWKEQGGVWKKVRVS